jgi:hypothetical protein
MNHRLPTPERIQSYLRNRGWREETRLPPAGVMYALAVQTASGQPLTVFAPELEEAFDYPLAVAAVVETLAAYEERPKATIHAEMLATDPAPVTPVAPAAPVPAPHANGSATDAKGVPTP